MPVRFVQMVKTINYQSQTLRLQSLLSVTIHSLNTQTIFLVLQVNFKL